MKLLCWIGYHRKLRLGVNPKNENTEPQCLICKRFLGSQQIQIGRLY
jgi:hypothetical protein